MFFLFVLFIIVLYIIYDVNYFVRTYFTVLSGRLYQRRYSLSETTTIFGACTFQDVDVWFRCIREARLIRELDFARYHFYDRTGIYERSRQLKIKSLQGCTLTLTINPIPLFSFYKINTKLVYWDDKSLFLEHEIVTLHDKKIRALFVSRQHAIGKNGDSSSALLEGLPGSEQKLECPGYLKHWFKSMEVTSSKLKRKVTLSK